MHNWQSWGSISMSFNSRIYVLWVRFKIKLLIVSPLITSENPDVLSLPFLSQAFVTVKQLHGLVSIARNALYPAVYPKQKQKQLNLKGLPWLTHAQHLFFPLTVCSILLFSSYQLFQLDIISFIYLFSSLFLFPHQNIIAET